MKWRIIVIFLVILFIFNLLLPDHGMANPYTNIHEDISKILQKVIVDGGELDQIRDFKVYPIDFLLSFDLDGVIESVNMPYIGTYYLAGTDKANIYIVYGDEVEFLVLMLTPGQMIRAEADINVVNLCEVPVHMNTNLTDEQIFTAWTNFNGYGIQLYTSLGEEFGLANLTSILSYISRFITSLIDQRQLESLDILYKETIYQSDLLDARKVAPFTVEVARLDGWELLRDINLIYRESYKYKVFKYLDIIYHNPESKNLKIRISLEEENWTQFKEYQVTGNGEFEGLPVEYFVCQGETEQGINRLEGARWRNGELWYYYITDLLGQDLELLADRIVEQLGADRVIPDRIANRKLYDEFSKEFLITELRPFFTKQVLDLDIIAGYQRNQHISYSDNIFGDVLEFCYENETGFFSLFQYAHQIIQEYVTEELNGLLIKKDVLIIESGMSHSNVTYQYFWSYKGYHFAIRGNDDTLLRKLIQIINAGLDD